MRLLSALFFVCHEMAAIESARPVWRAACPQDSSQGIGGCPPTSGVLFVQKDTACQEGVPYFGHLFENEKIKDTSDTIKVIITRKLAMKI